MSSLTAYVVSEHRSLTFQVDTKTKVPSSSKERTMAATPDVGVTRRSSRLSTGAIKRKSALELLGIKVWSNYSNRFSYLNDELGTEPKSQFHRALPLLYQSK